MDVARAPEAGLPGSADPEVLAWAAEAGRALLTHDANTMTRHAYERAGRGDAMPGVLVVPQIGVPPRNMSVGYAIEEILLFAQYSEPGEWEGQVLYVPLT